MKDSTIAEYNYLDKQRKLLDERQQELADFFLVPNGGVWFDKRGALTSVTWITSKGVIHPNMYSPPETQTLAHILAELNDYWGRETRPGLKGDQLRALRIAKILLSYYREECSPETWLKQSWEVLRSLRGTLPEFMWPSSPMVGKQLIHPRYRNGWEKLPEQPEEIFIPEGMRRAP